MHLRKKIILIAILVALVSCETIVPLTQNGQNLATATATRATASASTSATPQRISVRLERPAVYAYPGIINDFIVTPAIDRTQDELEQMFQY